MTDPDPSFDRWSRPQALSRRGYVLALLVPLLVAAAAFGVVSLVSAGDQAGGGTTVRLPVSGWAGDAGDSDGAALDGVIEVDDQKCVYLDTARGRIVAVWPVGYHATLDHNRLQLFDSHDTQVAQDGDRVRVDGGPIPAGTFSSEPCVPDSGEVFAVQSDVTVLK
jgi:hypothetical protein